MSRPQRTSFIRPAPDALYCSPAVELAGEALQEGAVLEAAVMRPLDLTGTHGVDITLERLAEMVEAYDPAIEMATLNFDHAFGGPAEGWCERVWLQGEALWARFVSLSAVAEEGIRSGRWVRRSAEFLTRHPATGGWYFTGMALLGNSRPAVWSLPPLQLHRSVHLIQLSEEPGAGEVVPAPQPPEETPMATTARPDPPAAPAAEPPMSERPPAPTGADAEAAERGAAELAAAVARLNAATATATRAAAETERRSFQLEAREALAKLGARLPPAARRIAEPLLVELRLTGSTATVKLADKSLSLPEALLKLLEAFPAVEALAAGELAGEDDPEAPGAADAREADVRKLHQERGVSDERLRELTTKYGLRIH
jgi:hypothetical protein